jgi:23S rRNA pseudouridine2605 synthase
MLLTNDGDLTHHLTHPSFRYEKEYEVLIKGKLNASKIHMIESGIKLDTYKTSSAVVKKLKSKSFNYSVTIHEGKKRQLRCMFDAIGHPVMELRRVRMGNLKLGRLKKGEVREVRRIEV